MLNKKLRQVPELLYNGVEVHINQQHYLHMLIPNLLARS